MAAAKRLAAIRQIIESAEHRQNQPELYFALEPNEARRIYRLSRPAPKKGRKR